MAEERDPGSVDGRVRRVLSGPTVLKPPLKGGGVAGRGVSSGGAESSPHPDPTVVGDQARPPARTGRVSAPTAIVGTERKRLPVSVEDLKKLAPDADPKVLAGALRFLGGYVAEDASDRTVVVWGNQLQRAYADLVSETLARSQADVLTRVTIHLNRTMEILRSIDLVAVANATRDGEGLGRYLGRLSKKIDTREELRRASVELDQLAKLMSAAMDDLLALRAEIERSSQRIDELGREVEASALAAQYLSTYLRDGNEGLSRRFLERSMSLTQTALQIRGSASIRESQIEQPLRLISAIQDVALVMLPAWLGSITSLTVLAGRTPTPTEAGEMAFQLRKILEQLQSE
ncbi:MAG: hypothetical protein HYX57_00520 [Chloroflexi bacterium]|nr:hypothetical protein [Chloroflexota bacterium]